MKQSKKIALIILGEKFTQKWVKEQDDSYRLEGLEKSAECSIDDVSIVRGSVFSSIICLSVGIPLIFMGSKNYETIPAVMGVFFSVLGALFVWSSFKTAKPVDWDLAKAWNEDRKMLLKTGVVKKLTILIENENVNTFNESETKDDILSRAMGDRCKVLAEEVRKLERFREKKKRETIRRRISHLRKFAKDCGIDIPTIKECFVHIC